jgi:CheY-like chemotaxis protein
VDERGRGLALGAAQYLVKPVRRDDLLSALERFGSRRKNGSPGRILAIDDDPLAVELIESVLSPAGYSVLKATSGEQGIALAESERPAMIILDLLMPEVDGFAVVEALSAKEATSDIPIVVLTSKSMSPADKARLNGKIAYLAQKTEFDRRRFVELVRRISAGEDEAPVKAAS